MHTQLPAKPIRTLDDVPGWFRRTDQLVMDRVLRYQANAGVTGDLLEMGVYLGKSAILLGFHRHDGERLVVCDLFGSDAAAGESQRTTALYKSATHETFEANFAAFHAEPATVIVGRTTTVPDHVPAGSFRFVHVDAGHLYDDVAPDIEVARSMLTPDGIVVFDDIRSVHTPGVPAAVWPEITRGDLRPVAITPNKLYATWGNADPIVDDLCEWIAATDGRFEVQTIAGQRIVRVTDWKVAPPSPVPPLGAPAREGRLIPRARRVAADLLPPVVTRAIKRARQPR